MAELVRLFGQLLILYLAASYLLVAILYAGFGLEVWRQIKKLGARAKLESSEKITMAVVFFFAWIFSPIILPSMILIVSYAYWPGERNASDSRPRSIG